MENNQDLKEQSILFKYLRLLNFPRKRYQETPHSPKPSPSPQVNVINGKLQERDEQMTPLQGYLSQQ